MSFDREEGRSAAKMFPPMQSHKGNIALERFIPSTKAHAREELILTKSAGSTGVKTRSVNLWKLHQATTKQKIELLGGPA